MSDRFDILRLERGDSALARAMNALYAESFDDVESYAAAPPDDAYLETILAHPGNIALVAKVGDTIVGALTGYTLSKFEQVRSEIYIYDLAVAERWRRRGVATALIARVQAIAREIGAWIIFVQADYGDDPAVALYTKLGTREDVMHFDLKPS